MPSAGVNGDELQNLNHECFLAFDVAFGFEFPGPLSKPKSELKTGSFLRGCLSEYAVCIREFRSSPVFNER